MKKYKAKVVFKIDIELPDESGLNSEEYLKIIASNAAYYGHDEHARVVNKEISVKAMEE